MSERQFAFVDGRWWDTWNDRNVTETADSFGCDSAATLIVTDGWCGCGTPDRVTELAVEYMRAVVAQEHDQTSTDASMLIAYRCDELGFTDHGTSLVYAWLTPAGEAWLALASDA